LEKILLILSNHSAAPNQDVASGKAFASRGKLVLKSLYTLYLDFFQRKIYTLYQGMEEVTLIRFDMWAF
jgi:hypothetical protein